MSSTCSEPGAMEVLVRLVQGLNRLVKADGKCPMRGHCGLEELFDPRGGAWSDTGVLGSGASGCRWLGKWGAAIIADGGFAGFSYGS
mmetsp:Transcript_30066/g.49916  ORF Transcript_30066/g.49916 Transcript_30066/m.49916 type:complete len:87 (-) Transcript_30066:88-348(-)